jgi:hypothetical protein
MLSDVGVEPRDGVFAEATAQHGYLVGVSSLYNG